MQKPPSAISGTYQWSQTYAYPWANPDDLMVENFATTDVQPSVYVLEARNPGGSLYRALGTHTFVAGQTTFIGLSPLYLPSVLLNNNDWNASIIARNNSARTAQVNTNFLSQDGAANAQATTFIQPHGSASLAYPGACFFCNRSAQAFASENAAAVVQTVYSGSGYQDGSAATAYTGFAAGSAAMNLPFVVYAPASGQYSAFTVQNPGRSPANITMTYINRNGVQDFVIADSIPVFGQRLYDLSVSGPKIPVWTNSAYFNTNGAWVGAVVVTSDQPITAMLTNRWSNWVVAYDGASSGNQRVYAPSVERRCTDCNPDAGSWQGFSVTTIQNLSTSSAYVTLRYIEGASGSTTLTIANQYLAPKAAKGYNTRTGGDVSPTIYNALQGAWVGSVIVDSTQPVAVVQYTIRPTSLIAGAYTGVHAGMAGVNTYLPAIYQSEAGGVWTRWSIIRIQNPGATNASNVDIYFYDQNGALTWQILDRSIAAGAIYSHNTKNDNPPLGHNWTGSMLITSDQPLVAVVETLHSDDWMVSYNGVSR